jgi:hypothetical protein
LRDRLARFGVEHLEAALSAQGRRIVVTDKGENPEIGGIEYQQGTLAGFEVREYLLAKWDRRCAYCDATDTPLNVRSTGSFNITTAHGTVQGISHRHCQLLHHGDGWNYSHRKEAALLPAPKDGVSAREVR